ncbi:hypothetical protein BLAT2472_10349 [Burkholderia latens]
MGRCRRPVMHPGVRHANAGVAYFGLTL